MKQNLWLVLVVLALLGMILAPVQARAANGQDTALKIVDLPQFRRQPAAYLPGRGITLRLPATLPTGSSYQRPMRLPSHMVPRVISPVLAGDSESTVAVLTMRMSDKSGKTGRVDEKLRIIFDNSEEPVEKTPVVIGEVVRDTSRQHDPEADLRRKIGLDF